MIKVSDKLIALHTKNTSLVFYIFDYNDERTPYNKGRQVIAQRYYGRKVDENSLGEFKGLICPHGSCDDYAQYNPISTTLSSGNNSDPTIIIENPDNTYSNRFFFKEYKIHKGGVDTKGPHTRNVEATLELISIDDVLNIELHEYYSILSDSDVIVSKKQIVNNNTKPINVLRLLSLDLPIDSTDLSVYSFDGKWLYERTRHETRVKSGTFVIDSKVGSSSHKHNPFIEVKDNDNNVYYGFNFIYSGNHRESVEVHEYSKSHVMVGINDFMFNYELSSGESFMSPEAIMVVKDSLDEITKEMHNFVLNHIINPDFNQKDRPIIYNTWEGVAFRLNEDTLVDMANIASRVGVELFVMDDGWFMNRKNDSSGLGDWTTDLEKFPNGLKSCVDKIKSTGLKFGIWVEPEMINLTSDICKAHPEYALTVPNREPLERRHQVMIDMAKPEVVDYLYESLTKVFDDIKPDYIKWDYNRFITEFYSKGIRPGEYFYKFMMGSYDLIDRLVKRYPNMLMESCSSGGGRFDLGMFYYMPQTWGSDDTNTKYRTPITCGTLAGYSQSTFGAHVSRDGSPRWPVVDASSLEDRFNLHSIGAFGYEFDFRTFPENELDIMSKQIVFYKKHRHLLQFGDFYIVDNVFDDNRYYSHIVVSPDKSEAILLVEQTSIDVPSKMWKAKGLDPNKTYKVTMRKQYNASTFETVVSGETLMNEGLDLGNLNNTTDKDLFTNGIFSRLLYIKEE